MPLIKITTTIHAPIARCFDLARSIDLHKLSTEGTEEEAIAGITSGLIGKDEQVTWRAKHFGIKQKLTSLITEFTYPFHFRDEMIKGPFKMIRHDHFFEETDHITTMRDHLQFESPGGLLGVWLNKLVLENYLRDLLIRRNEVIREVAEGDRWKTLLSER